MSEDVLTWLRSQIIADKEAAEAASKGEWVSDDGGSIHVGHPTNVVVDWVLNDEDLDHVLRQQPRDTIARCEADLAILDRVVPDIRKTEVQNADEFGAGWEDDKLTPCEEDLICWMAYGRRHRPGWNPDWTPEGMAP